MVLLYHFAMFFYAASDGTGGVRSGVRRCVLDANTSNATRICSVVRLCGVKIRFNRH